MAVECGLFNIFIDESSIGMGMRLWRTWVKIS